MTPIALEELGSGEPLVLVHGLATTRVVWRRVAPSLARARRVVMVDVPGFGASPPAGRGFDLDRVALQIRDGIDRAGVEGPYDLVGHSLGGALAATLAAAHPDRVRRLVLVAPGGLSPIPWPLALAFGGAAQALIPLRRTAAPFVDVSFARRLLLTPGTHDGASVPPAEARVLLTASRGATRIREALATVAAADLRPALARIRAPLGVVWGDHDRIVPPGGVRTVVAERPDAVVETVAEAGHIPMMERPSDFLAALQRVLERLPHNPGEGVPWQDGSAQRS